MGIIDDKLYSEIDRELEENSKENNFYKNLVQEAGGVDSTRARRKLGEWQQKARDFTEQTGIERDRAREFIGTADGKQPKGIFTDAKEIKGKETTLNAPIKKEYMFIKSKPKAITPHYDREIEAMAEKAKTLADTQKLGNVILTRTAEGGSSIFNEIAKVREIGVKDTMLKMAKGSDAGAMQSISEGLQYLPTRAGKQLLEYFEKNDVRAVWGGRGGLAGRTLQINGDAVTGVHEMGHILEKLNPWLAEAEKQFYNKRTVGEELRLLSEVTGRKVYMPDERCKTDHFLTPYMGKYIDGKHWEIFTTGLEHILFNKYPGTDKDFESFIIGLLLRI